MLTVPHGRESLQKGGVTTHNPLTVFYTLTALKGFLYLSPSAVPHSYALTPSLAPSRLN